MRYVGELISAVRRHTLNEGATATSGLNDEHFLQYLNDAQDRLTSILASNNCYLNEQTYTTSLVGGQREYNLPPDVLGGNRVTLVEYTPTADSEDYYPLQRVQPRELSSVEVTYPNAYIVRSNKLVVSPVPESGAGTLRITYARRLDRLDIRRGVVASHTDSGTQITALSLSTTGDDVADLDANDSLCVVDRDGTVTMYNIRYNSYDDGTGVVTLTGGAHTYSTGESVTNGSYVVTGQYTSTHSQLDDICERYLVKYAAREIIAIEDSSVDVVQMDQALAAMEQDIINLYTPIHQDVETIPIINSYYR